MPCTKLPHCLVHRYSQVCPALIGTQGPPVAAQSRKSSRWSKTMKQRAWYPHKTAYRNPRWGGGGGWSWPMLVNRCLIYGYSTVNRWLKIAIYCNINSLPQPSLFRFVELVKPITTYQSTTINRHSIIVTLFCYWRFTLSIMLHNSIITGYCRFTTLPAGYLLLMITVTGPSCFCVNRRHEASLLLSWT